MAVKLMSRGKTPNRFTSNRSTNLRDALNSSPDPKVAPKKPTLGDNIKKLQDLQTKTQPAFIIGKPGTGKTYLANKAFQSGPVNTWSCTMDNGITDLVGFHGRGDNWYEGPLTRAIQAGQPFVLDEAYMLSRSVLNALMTLFDDEPYLDGDLTYDGEILKPSPGFILVMTLPMAPDKGLIKAMSDIRPENVINLD